MKYVYCLDFVKRLVEFGYQNVLCIMNPTGMYQIISISGYQHIYIPALCFAHFSSRNTLKAINHFLSNIDDILRTLNIIIGPSSNLPPFRHTNHLNFQQTQRL